MPSSWSLAATVLALGLLLPPDSHAQGKPFALSNLVPPLADQTDILTVYVSTTGTPPPEAVLRDKANWRLNVTDADGGQEIALEDVRWQEEPGTDMVSLVFPRTAAGTRDLSKAGWRVLYLGGLNLTASLKAPTAEGLKAAKGKDDAAIYAFGSVLVGPSTKPIFVIDLKLERTKEIRNGWTRAYGFTLNTNTKAEPPADRVSIDPDAIKVLLSFSKPVHVGRPWLYGLIATVTPLQGEFTRKADVADATTAAQLQFVLPTVRHALTMYPQIGYELGHAINRPEKVGDRAVDLSEWQWITRLVAGGMAQWTLFKATPTDDDWYHVTVTGSYSARFPLAPEPFVAPGLIDGKRAAVVSVGKNTRHYADASLDWNVQKFTSLSLKYKYGAQAPLFKLVDHQWILGVTFKAARK